MSLASTEVDVFDSNADVVVLDIVEAVELEVKWSGRWRKGIAIIAT